MNKTPKQTVRDGYDIVSLAYRADDFDYENSNYKVWLSHLIPRLRLNARVVDLGCGCGMPVAKVLSSRFDVAGIDFSPVQIERAKRLAPAATFTCADITEIEYAPSSVDAVVSLYAVIHIPLEQQRPLFESVHAWLRPGGYFLVTVGEKSWEGVEEDWLGVSGGTMYWSHADAATYKAWLQEIGFEIVSEDFVPEGDSGHRNFLAKKRVQ